MNATVGKAMLAQVQRVNDSPERLREIIAEQDDEITRLRLALAAAHDILDQVAPDALRRPKSAGPSRLITEVLAVSGRPSISVSEAARRVGVNYFTAFRYVQEGWWGGEQIRGRWYIYADQTLTRKRGGKGRR